VWNLLSGECEQGRIQKSSGVVRVNYDDLVRIRYMEATPATLGRHRGFGREHSVRVKAAGGSASPSAEIRGGRATAN
jgi:hypothetical protein